MTFTTRLHHLHDWFSFRRANANGRRAGRKAQAWFRPRLEVLEDRLAPATHTWTGLSATSSNWSDAANWDAAGAPVTGTLDNQLVFPAAARQSNTNDLNNLFATSIQFTAPGYVLGGNVIALGEHVILESLQLVFSGGIVAAVKRVDGGLEDADQRVRQAVVEVRGGHLVDQIGCRLGEAQDGQGAADKRHVVIAGR